MLVRRDAMVHLELSRILGLGGAVCMTIEESDGQFGLPHVIELGPFDTGLDIGVWVLHQLRSADVVGPG